MESGGLGVGVRVRINKDDDITGTSQNIPVHPGKHSHMTKSSPRSMHSPLVQLMSSHAVILTTGVGETSMGELGDKDDEATDKSDDVGTAIEVAGVEEMNEVSDSGTSQKSPVHPAKHRQV